MQEQKDTMQNFIDFIIELANDEFDYCIEAVYIREISMRDYFRNGGCLELAKVLQYFVPTARIYTDKMKDHFVIQHNDAYYDAEEKYEANQEFEEVTLEYIAKNSEKYGKDVLFEGKPVHIALIQELKKCSGTYVSDIVKSLNNEAQSITRKLVTKVSLPTENK